MDWIEFMAGSAPGWSYDWNGNGAAEWTILPTDAFVPQASGGVANLAVSQGGYVTMMVGGDYAIEAWSVLEDAWVQLRTPVLFTDSYGNPYSLPTFSEGVLLERNVPPAPFGNPWESLATDRRQIVMPAPPDARPSSYDGVDYTAAQAFSRVTHVVHLDEGDHIRVGHHLYFASLAYTATFHVTSAVMALRLTRLPFPASTPAPTPGAVRAGDQRSGVRAGPKTIAGRTTAAPDAASSGGPDWAGSGV